MTKLELAILKWAPVRIVSDWAKGVTVPGSNGSSLYEIAYFFIREIRSNKLGVSCAAVTYNFLMAIPPTLLILFSLIPYLPLHNVQQTILDTLRIITPNPKLYNNASSIILDFMNNERGDVLSFGILLTLFFSSNGMMGLLKSFEKSLPIYVKHSPIKRRWTAIKLTFLLIGVAMLSLAVLIIQTEALNEILVDIFNDTIVIRITSLIIIILIIFSAISIIYRYGPSLSHRFKFVSVGSVVATILSVLTTTIFFFLVNNFLNYNKVYGPIGTLIAFMVWLWLNTLVILLGYELNVSVLLGKISQMENEAEEKKNK